MLRKTIYPLSSSNVRRGITVAVCDEGSLNYISMDLGRSTCILEMTSPLSLFPCAWHWLPGAVTLPCGLGVG